MSVDMDTCHVASATPSVVSSSHSVEDRMMQVNIPSNVAQEAGFPAYPILFQSAVFPQMMADHHFPSNHNFGTISYPQFFPAFGYQQSMNGLEQQRVANDMAFNKSFGDVRPMTSFLANDMTTFGPMAAYAAGYGTSGATSPFVDLTRRNMVTLISTLLLQKNRTSPAESTKQQIRELAKLLEYNLYRTAATFEAYANIHDMKKRIVALAETVVKFCKGRELTLGTSRQAVRGPQNFYQHNMVKRRKLDVDWNLTDKGTKLRFLVKEAVLRILAQNLNTAMRARHDQSLLKALADKIEGRLLEETQDFEIYSNIYTLKQRVLSLALLIVTAQRQVATMDVNTLS